MSKEETVLEYGVDFNPENEDTNEVDDDIDVKRFSKRDVIDMVRALQQSVVESQKSLVGQYDNMFDRLVASLEGIKTET